MSDDLGTIINELGNAFGEFRQEYDARLSDVEAKAGRPALGPKGEVITREQREHVDAFTSWLKAPHSKSASANLFEIERKVASTTVDSSGGYLVPEVLARRIAERVRDASPMRQVANVVTVGSSAFKHPLSNNDAESGWAGELDTRNATAEPTLEEAAPTFGMSYAYPSASEELLLDSAFSISDWFIRTVSASLAKLEGTAFVSGNGTKRPTGFLNATPAAAGDDDSPARTYPALEYIPTGNASGFGSLSLTSPEHYPADVLVDTVYGLKSGYRMNGRWMMNSTTAGTIRKFKDGDGRFLWADPIAAGQPPLLLGYPVVFKEQMPDISANAFPVAFGDFGAGYLICDQGGLRITVDESITTPGRTKWYVRRRVGGCTLDNNAVKLIKCATS